MVLQRLSWIAPLGDPVTSPCLYAPARDPGSLLGAMVDAVLQVVAPKNLQPAPGEGLLGDGLAASARGRGWAARRRTRGTAGQGTPRLPRHEQHPRGSAFAPQDPKWTAKERIVADRDVDQVEPLEDRHAGAQ